MAQSRWDVSDDVYYTPGKTLHGIFTQVSEALSGGIPLEFSEGTWSHKDLHLSQVTETEVVKGDHAFDDQFSRTLKVSGKLQLLTGQRVDEKWFADINRFPSAAPLIAMFHKGATGARFFPTEITTEPTNVTPGEMATTILSQIFMEDRDRLSTIPHHFRLERYVDDTTTGEIFGLPSAYALFPE